MKNHFFWLCLLIVLAGSQVGRGEPPGPKQIDKLIAQLGSPNFAEREAAYKSLDGIGDAALSALHKAESTNPDPEIRRRAKQLIDVIENRLDHLLAVYKEYGLLLPPPKSQLVRFGPFDGGLVNGKPQPVTYSLGFLIDKGTEEQPPTILDGTWTLKLQYQPKVIVMDPERAAPREIEAIVEENSLDLQGGLPTAIQCYSRGWKQLAEALFNESLRTKVPEQGEQLTPKRELAKIAWDYWEMQLHEPDTDWSMIARRLKHFLEIEKTLSTVPHRRLLESLDAALVPSKAKPGSIAAKIDALIDVRYPGISLQEGEPDARYAELAALGFAAVPELINHVDDDRLTRALRIGFNNFPTYQLRLGEVVSDLLQRLAGEDLGKNWVERRQGYGVEKKDALAWWEKAKRQSEEKYLVEHAVPAEGKWLNDHILWLIARKSPRHLPAIYLRVLDQGQEIISWPLAELIGNSLLPKKQKLEVFLRAAQSPRIEHRPEALREIRKLDPEKFVTLLLENLNAFPKTPAKEYWFCPQVELAHLVRLTDDRRVWDALLNTSKRCDIGLRMQFLDLMWDPYHSGVRRQRLEFLAAFLEDASIRDVDSNREMYHGPYAGWDFPRLEVRNFAAIKMAYILKLPVKLPRGRFAEPFEYWTPEQWARFRTEVKEAFQRDLESNPKSSSEKTDKK